MAQLSLIPLLDRSLPFERADPADEAVVRERLARILPAGVRDPVIAVERVEWRGETCFAFVVESDGGRQTLELGPNLTQRDFVLVMLGADPGK